MQAAKRLHDNSYDQRLETAALAKAYLDNLKVEASIDFEKEAKKLKNGKVCNVIAIFTSLTYCLMIFALILMPLIKETSIHKMKVEISSHGRVIQSLEREQEELTEALNTLNFSNIEEIATLELKMVKRNDTMKRGMVNVPYVSLEAAKNSYYNTTIDYMSKSDLD